MKHPAVALDQPDKDGQVPIARLSHNVEATETAGDSENYGLPADDKNGKKSQVYLTPHTTAHHDNLKPLSDQHPLKGHVVGEEDLNNLKGDMGTCAVAC